ncbi:DUF3231 family protein [Salipaludibacillus sp. CUR1]|uniref:Coat F domain-containing protein n=1 Tax=Salipaludibacillus aurantiacus TaxID=1601833 RepID=A0A1H9UYK4_9BACI|nr:MULTISPECIES: DUF3231 family protein [Salipaludibacillus]MCE7794009.1 DUF3231 family protein [Salipaludibacillus sp. CUR1]SES14620.1 Protein of unknown function [Salipaludibacillus aurantiacus]
MGILSGNQQNEPLHYGEIFSTWTYSHAMKAAIATYQVYENHCGDVDLKKFIRDVINTARDEETQVDQVLKANGIGLPPSPPERPQASVEEIPPGARFNDPEIAMHISTDMAAGLVSCSQAMAQCTREDIAIMFGQFHQQRSQQALRLLKLNKEKGWLVPPPLEVERPHQMQTT